MAWRCAVDAGPAARAQAEIRLPRPRGAPTPSAMQNAFYTAYDEETLGGRRKTDYRSAFQIDRDRVIHAHAFRKLQSKTQVFLSGEHDFYRTRLTHSMEVAQIGRSICRYLESRGGPMRDNFHLDSDLVECACLAHDLGHPPFGHSGERTLQELMQPYGGFEGNAQTLHLVTETLYQNESGVRWLSRWRSFTSVDWRMSERQPFFRRRWARFGRN